MEPMTKSPCCQGQSPRNELTWLSEVDAKVTRVNPDGCVSLDIAIKAQQRVEFRQMQERSKGEGGRENRRTVLLVNGKISDKLSVMTYTK